MRTTSAATASAAKILLGACAVVAATGLAASPAWANQAAQRRHFPPSATGTTTTTGPGATTTTTSSTTTTVGLPSPQPPSSAPEDNCVPGAWPQSVQGRPPTFQAGDDGVYLWHDPDGGWALRATHSGLHDRVIISGTLHSTDGRFVFVHRVRDEGNDIVALSANHRTILFRFVNYGWVDGLDFATHCSSGFTASFFIEGTPAPTSAVHLGAAAANPTSNPFDVERMQVLGSDGGVPTTTSTTTPMTARAVA